MPIKATILCLDDEAPALQLRSMVLQSAGYRVLPATQVEEAMKLFQENQVDLVISDHLLQGATGAEVARTMKKLKPQVPIMLLSGLAEIPEGADAVDSFVSKGQNPADLLLHIDRMLKRSA